MSAVRAIGYREPLSIDTADSLVDIDLPRPAPVGRDLLVEVRAVSVNPVDAKIRQGVKPEQGQWKVLGWDAAGVVVDAGPEATQFKRGDAVYYAGSLVRSGTNAELHCVDERIVGRKPHSLDWSQAAALPLTTITAWEVLFDRLQVNRYVASGAAPAILIIGGAGGVGSMAIQLARQLTDLQVIATASRPETRQWALQLGAHHVVDHGQPLADQLAALLPDGPTFVFCTTHTQQHLEAIARLIAPQGRFALIDDPPSLDITPFKRKSVSVHWELMFTRSLFATPDLAAQGELLNEVSRLVDAGTLRTTQATHLGTITAEHLRQAHALIESGSSHGKIVLEGFPA